MARAELDLAALERRLAPRGVAGMQPLTGGASSLTFTATLADRRPVVVKVAPPGLEPVLHRDVLRQSRLMRALHATPVAVPEVLWEDAGEPPTVPPLFVMSFIGGASCEPLFDRDGQDAEGVMAERMRNAARALAALHSLDPIAVGLGGEPRSGLHEEVTRWCQLLETVDPALAPGWESVAGALRDSTFTDVGDAIVHGDFRLGNLLATGTEITAVIDWEIWSVGDPRVDVGWFLVNADPATYQRSTRYVASLPSPAELTAEYAETLGRNTPELALFQALACFKSAATWSLIVKHNRRRREPDPDLEEMVPLLPHLLDRARQLID
jgi:aminoglycoside phosphotransferase (APT) family kinase protein